MLSPRSAAFLLSFSFASPAFAATDIPSWVQLMQQSQKAEEAGQMEQAGTLALDAVKRADESFGIMDARTAQALNRAAHMNGVLGNMKDAEAELVRARSIGEHEKEEHPLVLAETLLLQADLLRVAGKLSEAQAAAQQGLDLRRAQLGSEHPDVAEALQVLASVRAEDGLADEAETLLKEAVGIQRRAPKVLVSVEDPVKVRNPQLETARTLNALASLYTQQAKYAQAQPLADEAKELAVASVGESHAETAEILGTLSELARHAGVYDEAERLRIEQLHAREAAFGKQHPKVGESIQGLARVRRSQGRNDEAERFYLQAIGIDEAALGKEHPDLAKLLADLAGLYVIEDRRVEAITLYDRALGILERSYGLAHPATEQVALAIAPLRAGAGPNDPENQRYQRILSMAAQSLNRRAGVYHNLGEYAAAEELFKQAIEMLERAFGPEHPDVAVVLENYAALLRKMGRAKNAEETERRAAKIRAKQPPS